MSDVRVAVAGAGGRMGRALVQAVTEGEGLRLGAATEQPGSSLLDTDAGELAGVGRLGFVMIRGLLWTASMCSSTSPLRVRPCITSSCAGTAARRW